MIDEETKDIIKKNWARFIQNIQPWILFPICYQFFILNEEDIEIINNEVTTIRKADKFLKILISSPFLSVQILKEVFENDYMFLIDIL
ncbi:unnamed protein product [Gordionus sp. m RMFG-2023]